MKYYLMHKDDKVLSFTNTDVEVISDDIVPWFLRGRLLSEIIDPAIPQIPQYDKKVNPDKFKEEMDRYQNDIQEYFRIVNINKRENNNIRDKNRDILTSYFAKRVLPLTRDNAKVIYNLFNMEQLQDDHSKTKIALFCRNLSLLDDYWVKKENDDLTWEQVNLRTNHLNEIVGQVALYGDSISLTPKEDELLLTPELTTNGAFAKAWFREDDGLYLYKLDGQRNNAKIEVMVSNLLDKTNVKHLKYEYAVMRDKDACKCKCMTTDSLSILPAVDYKIYCKANGLSFTKQYLTIDPDAVYKMWIVDYLISNPDRHGNNWGFYYDSNTMEIKGLHPLYDNNMAFDESLMKNKDMPYRFNKKMTMKQAALEGIKRTDFHFIDTVGQKDFLSYSQFASFVDRAKDLGLDPAKRIYSIKTPDADGNGLKYPVIFEEAEDIPSAIKDLPKNSEDPDSDDFWGLGE